MQPQDVVFNLQAFPMRDVGAQQPAVLDKFACQSIDLWAIVHAGRSQAALTSQKGAAQSTPHKEKWSRGCRALKLRFWRFARLPLLQPAPRRKSRFTLTTQLSRLNRPIPANTSKTIGRGSWANEPTSALFLSAGLQSADRHLDLGAGFAVLAGGLYERSPNNRQYWSFPCGRPPFLQCFFLPLLPPAPNPRRRLNLCRLRLRPNRPIPANTNNQSGQACPSGPARSLTLHRPPALMPCLSHGGDFPVEGASQTRMRGQPC